MLPGQGDDVAALGIREQGLMLRQEAGVDDDEFSEYCEKLAIQYNSVAMQALRLGAATMVARVHGVPCDTLSVLCSLCLAPENSGDALAMLNKAEVLTAAGGLFSDRMLRAKLRALTFNNFGCVYKQYVQTTCQ